MAKYCANMVGIWSHCPRVKNCDRNIAIPKGEFTQSILRGVMHCRLGHSKNKKMFFQETNGHFTRRNLPQCEYYLRLATNVYNS